MLAAPDQDIIRRDLVVPQLAMLFDPEAFVRVLSDSFPEVQKANAEISYVRYKAEKSCLVLYTLTSGESQWRVYAKAHPDPAEDSADSGAGRMILKSGSVVATLFPEDKQMRVISKLFQREKRTRFLRRLIPKSHFSSVNLKVLTYLPERRFVCSISDHRGSHVVLKTHDETGFASACACTANFDSTDYLRIAKRLGISHRHRLLAYEWLPGNVLNEALLQSDFDFHTLEFVGTALAELHRSKQASRRFLDRRQEAATLLSLAEHLAYICPAQAARIQFLSNAIAEKLSERSDCNQTIHADFSAKQVVVDGERIGIIDLDRAALGDPALDLGNFLAYLERDVIYGRLSSEKLPIFREALICGYNKIGTAPPTADIDFYIVLGLFRLLPDPFRYHQPGWAQVTESILYRAESLFRNLSKHSSISFKGFSQELTK
jgi:hypothetical protein